MIARKAPEAMTIRAALNAWGSSCWKADLMIA